MLSGVAAALEAIEFKGCKQNAKLGDSVTDILGRQKHTQACKRRLGELSKQSIASIDGLAALKRCIAA